MKPFGTWGTGASFSLGGVIGCTLGLAGIALGGWVPLVGLGVAIVAGVAAGAAINAWDRATGDFNKEIAKASTAKVSTKTVSEKILTGAVVTGYVALAALTVTDVAKPTIETNPTAIVETDPTATVEIVPTMEPVSTPESLPTQDQYGCDTPGLSPEVKANCGEHTYNISVTRLAGDLSCSEGGTREDYWRVDPNTKSLQVGDHWEKIGEHKYKATSRFSNTGEISHITIIEFTTWGIIFESEYDHYGTLCRHEHKIID